MHKRMAFVNEVPWHGLGVKVPPTVSAAEMIEKAGLNWTVAKVPAPGAVEDRRGRWSRYALQRDPVGGETGPVLLAVVSDAYQVLQNSEAFAFFEPFIATELAQFETAGALGQGERVWVLARLRDPMLIAPDDAIDRFLLLSNSHDGRGAVTVRFTPIRVVCQNTLSLALRGGDTVVRVNHSKRMQERLTADQFTKLADLAQETFGHANSMFQAFAARSLNQKEFAEYLAKLFPPTEAQRAKGKEPERWQRIREILDDQRLTPRRTSNTLWALYNAVVHDEDFRRADQTPDRRLERVWFGSGADLKLKALKYAGDLVGMPQAA